MTTTVVASQANAGNLATSELDLQVLLRRQVIPKFFEDIDNVGGKPWWRKQLWTQAVAVGDRDYLLPNDFNAFIDDPKTSDGNTIGYRGEFDHDIITAEFALANNQTDSQPLGYYLLPDTEGTPTLAAPRLWLTSIPAAAFTMKGIYERTIYFANDSTEVELNPYIPPKYQYALVFALKELIAIDRYGAGDKRATLYKDQYWQVVNGTRLNKHAAPRNRQFLLR